MKTQLSLDLARRDRSSFANFSPGPNREVVERLQALAAPAVPSSVSFLWGEAGSGKSHLLQATCRALHEHGRSAAYLPLREARSLSPALLDEREHADLVCVDDIDGVAGAAAWEAALLGLFERVRERGGCWLAAARAAPAFLGLRLPDLATRLGAGPVYQLRPLTDDDRIAAIQLRAHNRGFAMPDDAARFILQRFPRDMPSLFDLLERIDRLTLAAQRRVTVPFLRELLAMTPALGAGQAAGVPQGGGETGDGEK